MGVVSEGDAAVQGDTFVDGRLDVFRTTVSHYKTSNQGTQDVGEAPTKITFNGGFDQLGGWEADAQDTYTVQNNGMFHVEAQIQWSTVPGADTQLTLEIQQADSSSDTNPTTLARNVEFVGDQSWDSSTAARASRSNCSHGPRPGRRRRLPARRRPNGPRRPGQSQLIPRTILSDTSS